MAAAFNTTTTCQRHWHLEIDARAVHTLGLLLACSSARPTGGERYSNHCDLDGSPWPADYPYIGAITGMLNRTHAYHDVSASQACPAGAGALAVGTGLGRLGQPALLLQRHP